jgi:uncharacterized protein (TIGR00730 family)
MNICVYGAASDAIDESYKEAARAVGAELARNNVTMIFGGGAVGLMGACAEGCLEQNGTVFGVVPDFMNDFEPILDKCACVIKTKDMADRKKIMEKLADSFIILPGGVGTFDEFFQIITLAELKQKKAKIIIYNVNNYFEYILKSIQKGIEEHFIRENISDYYVVCNSPEDINDAFVSIKEFM